VKYNPGAEDRHNASGISKAASQRLKETTFHGGNNIKKCPLDAQKQHLKHLRSFFKHPCRHIKPSGIQCVTKSQFSHAIKTCKPIQRKELRKGKEALLNPRARSLHSGHIGHFVGMDGNGGDSQESPGSLKGRNSVPNRWRRGNLLSAEGVVPVLWPPINANDRPGDPEKDCNRQQDSTKISEEKRR